MFGFEESLKEREYKKRKRSIKSIIFLSRQCLVCRKYKKRNKKKLEKKL